MPYVTCPTCGERGKIPPSLLGARIKCRKCGVSFMVAAPAAKAGAAASTTAAAAESATLPSAVAEPLHGGIEVEGLDASSWSIPSETGAMLKAENTAEPGARSETGAAFVAAEPGSSGAREYKLLTPKDKIFDGKFDLARLEDALNHFGRQGWVVKAVTTPHVKGFSGLPEEMLVVLLERG